jgi:hypothetical protein
VKRARAKAAKMTAVTIACLAGVVGCGAAPIDAVAISNRSLARQLVAHWAFDEGDGTVVTDRSGNGHNGQLVGGTWLPRGRFGGALRLVPGDTVTIPAFPQATPSWTVSVWVQVSAADLTANTDDTSTLLSAEAVFAGGWQVHLDTRPGYERLDVAYWVGEPVNDYVVLLCKCIEVDKWIHLTATFDAVARRFSLYRDSALVDGASLPNPILPGDSTLYIGRWNMNGRSLSADIDDFAIWARALTDDEVAATSLETPPDSL